MKILLALVVWISAWTSLGLVSGVGHLEARVVIIDELSPRPVAFTDFVLQSSGRPDQIVRTDADGFIRLDLESANYVLKSVDAVAFRGTSYKWSKAFAVESDKTCSFTLTQADAEKVVVRPERQISDEAQLYQQFKRAVVTVFSDDGQGSGFLVDSRGLILTNYHVAGASSFLCVRLEPGRKYEAKLVASDQASDVAVLLVNPKAFEGIEPLHLLPANQQLGVEGEKVIAIGSPLHQEKALTTGIISKIEPDAIISDVNINHGNSGGPLLNMAGDVVGITTFGDLPPGTGGPGISGVISIRKSDSVLHGAIENTAAQSPPTDVCLPDVPSSPIPDEILRKVAADLKGDPFYFKNPKNFRTYISTPFDAYALQLRYDKEIDKKLARRYKGKVPPERKAETGPRFFWEKYVGGQLSTAIVQIRVIPWPQETSSSQWSHGLFGAAAGRAKYELRDDFARMVLLRNGTEVQPIYRYRVRDVTVYEDYNVEINDTAYMGMYCYDPRVFEPNAELELRVWKNDRTDFTSIKFDKKQQERIWKMFEEWAASQKGS